ncbi:MAG: hypothetical protein IJE62_06760, partial [Clostridia bacterium]|nr:hypothetical protein [Clostridia bacterium]
VISLTGTVKFHSLNLFDFWKKCEECLTAGYTVACKRVTEGVGIALNVLHSFGNLQASLCYTRWQHFSAAPKNQTESSSGTIAGEQCLRRRCESIGCDEGRFTFPEECCLQPLPLVSQRSVL